MKDRNDSQNTGKEKGLFSRREVLKAAGTVGIMAAMPAPLARRAFGAAPEKKDAHRWSLPCPPAPEHRTAPGGDGRLAASKAVDL